MIGIFDSGAGGLSVFREIYKMLPGESYIYYADNAHCPYGEKSREYVIGRAVEITEFLIRHGAGIIVIACNTATTAAIACLREKYSDKSDPEVRKRVSELSGGRIESISFIGTEPAVKPAAAITKSGVIGVLATAGTLKGQKYTDTRDLYAKGIKVVEQVGKGFVEAVERGETEGPEAERIAEAAVRPLVEAGADAIVLGCTHYPFLKDAIEKTARRIAPDREITVIDPAPAIARRLLAVMDEEGTGNSAGEPSVQLCASGDDALLKEMASRIISGTL